jgi:hypothetical protein
MGYDLILQAPRETLIPPEEKHKLIDALRLETKLDFLCELTVRRDGAYPGDSQALSKYFEKGSLSADEYQKFCTVQNLSGHGQAEADFAARMFINYKWGQGLIVTKMPPEREDVRKAYHLIVDFARRYKLVVHDPQIGKDIDLDNPGELPPMYGPDPGSKRGWFSWRKGKS